MTITSYIAYSNEKMLAHFRKTIELGGFKYRDEGPWKSILGLDVTYSREEGVLEYGHETYIKKLFGMLKLDDTPIRTTPVKPGVKLSRKDCPKEVDKDLQARYRSILGGIGHIARWSHAECQYAVSVASQYQSNPGQKHMDYLLDIAGYLRGAMKRTVKMTRKRGLKKLLSLHGYCDADYAADVDTRRSRSGFCFYLNGNFVGSQSKLQASVSLSTAESEFMALTLATTFAIWAMQWLTELGFDIGKPVTLYSDNQSCIAIAKAASINFKYSKHIDVRQMFIRQILKQKDLEVLYVKSALNISDGLTKPRGKAKFREFRDELCGQTDLRQFNDDDIETSLKEVLEIDSSDSDEETEDMEQ